MAAATNTRFMALRVIGAWRPHPVWHVPTNVCSAGGTVFVDDDGMGGACCHGFLVDTTRILWVRSGGGRWTTLSL